MELADIEPRIWRRLLVADTTPLPLLHRILQVAFSWRDHHLHEFKVGTVFFGVPDDDDPPPHIDEKHVRLYQLVHEPGERLTYLYDFGDSWEHDLVLEDMKFSATMSAGAEWTLRLEYTMQIGPMEPRDVES